MYCSPELIVQIYCTSRLIVFLVSVLASVHGDGCQYNGGLLPPRYYTVDPMWLHWGTLFNTMKSLCPYSQCSHLNLLTCLVDVFVLFFKQTQYTQDINVLHITRYIIPPREALNIM